MSNTTEILNLITGMKNGSFLTVEKSSKASLRKTGNPLRDANIEKHSTFQVQVGCDMQRIENKRALREGRQPVAVGALPWGEYVGMDLPVIKHKGNLYLRGFWARGIVTTYTVNGQPATDAQLVTIKEFSPKGTGLSKTAPMTIKFDNIKRLSGGGKTINV